MKREAAVDRALHDHVPGGGEPRRSGVESGRPPEKRAETSGLPPLLCVTRREPAATGRDGVPAFPVHHPYVELLYTSSIGPLGIILLRRLAEIADGSGAVPTVNLAIAAGVRTGSYEEVGGKSPIAKALRRLARFGLVDWSPDGKLVVVDAVDPLPHHQLQRLPECLQRRHAEFVSEAAKAA